MDWLRINKNLPSHPKSRALARALGEPVSWWRVAQVWAWCVEFAPDGKITTSDPVVDIEDAASWTGERGEFVTACVREKFLDKTENGFAVHDWDSHNGAALKKAQRELDRVRKWRKKKKKEVESSNAPVTRNKRVQNANVTGRPDQTRPDVTDLKHTPAGDAAGDSPERLQAVWNEHAKPAGLRGWKDTPPKRLEHAKARLSERRIEGPDGWREVISRLAASSFCRGGGPRGWRANPTFLLRPETATRVLEGEFDDSGSAFRKNGSFAAESVPRSAFTPGVIKT